MYNNTAENKRLDMGSKNLCRKRKGEQFWSYQATSQHVQFNVVSSHSSSVIGVRVFAMLFKKMKKKMYHLKVIVYTTPIHRIAPWLFFQE